MDLCSGKVQGEEFSLFLKLKKDRNPGMIKTRRLSTHILLLGLIGGFLALHSGATLADRTHWKIAGQVVHDRHPDRHQHHYRQQHRSDYIHPRYRDPRYWTPIPPRWQPYQPRIHPGHHYDRHPRHYHHRKKHRAKFHPSQRYMKQKHRYHGHR